MTGAASVSRASRRRVHSAEGAFIVNPSIAVFYGSTTGNTQMAAEKIKARLGARVPDLHDVISAEPDQLERYDLILFGVPTWNVGEMQDDWADFIPRMEGLSLAGKKVAFFGVGDARGYPENFLDALGELWEAVAALGNPQLIGVWPTEGYNFEESKGMYDDDHFIGLGLDEDNESELTDARIEEWLTQVLQEAGIPDLADTGEVAAASASLTGASR